jgi:hypothetical protein
MQMSSPMPPNSVAVPSSSSSISPSPSAASPGTPSEGFGSEPVEEEAPPARGKKRVQLLDMEAVHFLQPVLFMVVALPTSVYFYVCV